MRRTGIIGGLVAVAIGVVLGATVFRSDIANATGLSGGTAPVTVYNTSTNPVPVQEQAIDGNGNLKVHEQGTANVSVTNTPAVTLDTSGNTVKLDPSKSTVTLDSTDSGKLDTANAHLGNIDTATGKLNFDGSGNLKVNVASGGTADPTVADQSPFGFGGVQIASGKDDQIPIGVTANVTSFAFSSDNDVEITLSDDVNGRVNDLLRFVVKGGTPIVQSLAHAMKANSLDMYCLSGSDCTVTYSVIGY